MIERYTKPEMGHIWTEYNEWDTMKQVEILASEAQAELGNIPKEAAKEIREKAAFSVDRIHEIEAETHHDIAAFVSTLSENIGEAGKYVHLGLTSTDVKDTALGYMLKQASDILIKDLENFHAVLRRRAVEFKYTPCIGRTHGIHAEATTFGLKLDGCICADIGASTGGFTDCMLQNGATKVYAVDVGYGQLDWKLRSDERVVCMERTNARYLDRDQIPDELDFASIDVSFISLKLILPAVHRVLKEGGHVACLIKPQFEAGREKVGKKGVVRDPDVHLEVLENFLTHAKDSGFTVLDITFSPIRGPEGNIEYLGYLESGDWVEKTFDLQGLVEQSHAALDHGKERAGC